MNALSDLGVTKYDHSRRITYYLVLAFCNHWAGKRIEPKNERSTDHPIAKEHSSSSSIVFESHHSAFGDGAICSTAASAAAPPKNV